MEGLLRNYFWWSPLGIVELMIIVSVVVILVFAFWLLFRKRRSCSLSGPYPGRAPETALDILKKRYAQGEINKDEFERMKRDIML